MDIQDGLLLRMRSLTFSTLLPDALAASVFDLEDGFPLALLRFLVPVGGVQGLATTFDGMLGAFHAAAEANVV